MKRLLGGVVLLLLASFAGAQAEYASVVKVKRSFADVKESLVAAIEERGLVINTTSRVGSMLERTGKDIGDNRQIFQDAEVIEFCSAKVSRMVTEVDPQAIVLCPYAISIYTLPGQADTVYVGYRKFPADPRVKAAADLVGAIVKDSTK